MERRKFLRAGVAGVAAVGATALAAPAVHAAKNIRWKMTTSFPPGLPFYQSGPGSAEWIVDQIDKATDGRPQPGSSDRLVSCFRRGIFAPR